MLSNSYCLVDFRVPFSLSFDKIDGEKEELLLFGSDVVQLGKFDALDQLVEAGNSRVPNVVIGAAFQYMYIIEKWGTGISRIQKEAAEYGLRELELKDFGTSIRIDVIRKPSETDLFGVAQPQTNDTEHDATQARKWL